MGPVLPARSTLRIKVPTPERLPNPTDSTRHTCITVIAQIAQQRLFQRALRHTGVVEIGEARSHARRAVTSFLARPWPTLRRETCRA